MAIVVQHKGFPYLQQWLGLNEVATLEPKPGVEPTSGHLAEVLAQLQQQPARHDHSRRLQRRPRIGMAGGAREDSGGASCPSPSAAATRAKDLFGLFDDTINRLLAAGVKP